MITCDKKTKGTEKRKSARLAMLLNVYQTMISRYEKGLAYPDIDILIAIAKHYNVSVDYLIGFFDDKMPYTKSNFPKQEQDLFLLFEQLDSIQREKTVSYIQGINDGYKKK